MSRLTLVTGGTRGIGAATCIALKGLGYKVVTSHYGSAHQDDADEFSNKNNIPVYEWNVANYEECIESVAKIEKDHGGIEILINNAGIISDSFMHKMNKQAWQSVIDINLTGCFNMCSAIIGKMRERKFGRIVNISSVNALAGCMGQVNYCASKAGIIGLTKALALESAARGITVNAVAPGYVDTEMTQSIPEDIRKKIALQIPVGRFAAPEEIARIILFLVDDAAGFITGETISANGGFYLQ